jgi:hypothetical protein
MKIFAVRLPDIMKIRVVGAELFHAYGWMVGIQTAVQAWGS